MDFSESGMSKPGLGALNMRFLLFLSIDGLFYLGNGPERIGKENERAPPGSTGSKTRHKREKVLTRACAPDYIGHDF